jgi:hypothetical protein
VFNKVRQCGNPGQPACNSNTCCDYAGPQKCGNSGVKCPYGYKLDFNMVSLVSRCTETDWFKSWFFFL